MLSDKLKSYRLAKKLSQTDVAMAVGLSQGAVSLWERGVTTPSLDQLRKVANLFDISVHDLLDAENKDSKQENDAQSFEHIALYREAKPMTPEQIKKRRELVDLLWDMDDDAITKIGQVIDIYHRK